MSSSVTRFPPAFWAWARWVDTGRKGPRPQGVPRFIPPHWWARYLIHGSKGKPPLVQPSVFSQLGAFVSQASSWPHDTPSAQAFIAAGGKWIAVQWGDTATEANNLRRFDEGWDERWRQQGVKVLGWHRTEHIKGDEGEWAVDMTDSLGLDGYVLNPETPAELQRTHDALKEYRATYPQLPLAVITLGKIGGFPTGALAEQDAHIILECFLETPQADTTVTNSVRYWLASQVERPRIHCCLLAKTGYDTPWATQAGEAKVLGVHGISTFTGENTPAAAWRLLT